MPIDNDRLLAAIDEYKPYAYGSAGMYSDLSFRRQRAIESYLGLNVNPAHEGRSQVVDRSVYETLSTIIPSLVRIFSGSSDAVCQFKAIGPEDEPSAEQTTAVVNWAVTEKNPWEQVCQDWIHDACLLSNGYAMAYWDESQTKTRERYEGQSDEQLAMLAQDKGVTIVEHTSRVDEQQTEDVQKAYEQAKAQWQQIAQLAAAQGQMQPPEPPAPQPVTVHDVVIERTETTAQAQIRVLPPEHCLIDGSTPDWTLKDCNYFEYREDKTIADLRAMGFDVPGDISDSDEDDDDAPEDLARNRFAESVDDEGKGALRKVTARMIWVRADAESDGDVRMYYILAVGRTILFAEPCSRIHVVSLTPQPLPHRHVGMSVAETVMDLQDLKTAIIRGGVDNLFLANAARALVSSKVSLDDYLDARAGAPVRMIDDSLPGEGHIVPLAHPVVFDSVIPALQYFDEARQTRSGAWKQFSGTDATALNRTATGAIAQQSFASMRVEHIARTMAPAIEELFSLVWELISKHQNKPLTLKLSGQWVAVDPQAWRTKRDVRISVGVSAANSEMRYGMLQQMLANQLQTMPLGLCGPQEIAATMTEMAKSAGFANATKFWKDGQRLQPVPPQPMPEQIKSQTQLQIKQMELQADAQKFQAQTALAEKELMMKAEVDRLSKERELAVQASNDQRDAQREQERAAMDAAMKARELEFEQWKAKLDADTQLMITQMKLAPDPTISQAVQGAAEQIQQLLGIVNALQEYHKAPAQLVRDPNTGRAVAVRKGDVVRSIQRGPDGRAIGLQ